MDTERGRAVSVAGVALEAVCDAARNVEPAALAIGGSLVYKGEKKLEGKLLCQLLMMSGHKSLVTYSVDYLASLILPHDLDTLRAAWREDPVSVGPYSVQVMTGRQLWIRRNGIGLLINDLRRWSPGGLADLCLSLGLDDPGELKRWDILELEEARATARRCSLLYGEIAERLDTACVNLELPRYWRDGPGRIGGALLDRMATPYDIRLYPSELEPMVFAAYFGGRIDILGAGEFDTITQLDIRSAYPWAMAELPSLDNARWFRRSRYDPAAPYAVWWCEWDVPDGVSVGPFPVRYGEESTAYPRTGRGYYWAPEVAAAKRSYGTWVRVGSGMEFRPATDRRPFAELATHYEARRLAKEAGLVAEAQLLKLALNAAYGRLAQERLPDGTRGRWANIALAGLLTATVRARMLETAQEYEGRVLAILTDSLTLEGEACHHEPGPELGAWSVKRGTDALLLPSGAYHVGGGEAELDRVAGMPLEQSRGIKWERIRKAWRSYGLIARELEGIMRGHKVEYPYYIGIGQAAGVEGGARFRRWMRSRWDVIGGPHPLSVVTMRDGGRAWFRPAALPADVTLRRYVPVASLFGRRPHQQHLSARYAVREIDQPAS